MLNPAASSSQASDADSSMDFESRASISTLDISGQPEAYNHGFDDSTLEFSLDSTQVLSEISSDRSRAPSYISTQVFSEQLSLATTQEFPPRSDSRRSQSVTSDHQLPQDSRVSPDVSFENQVPRYASTLRFSEQSSVVSSHNSHDQSMRTIQHGASDLADTTRPAADLTMRSPSPGSSSSEAIVLITPLPDSSSNSSDSLSSIPDRSVEDLDVSMQTAAPLVAPTATRRTRPPRSRRTPRRVPDSRAMDVSMMSTASAEAAQAAPQGALQQQQPQVQAQAQEVSRSNQLVNVNSPRFSQDIQQQQYRPAMMNPRAARMTLGPGRQTLPPAQQWPGHSQHWPSQVQQPTYPALEATPRAYQATSTRPNYVPTAQAYPPPLPVQQPAVLPQEVIASAYAQGFAEAQRRLAETQRPQSEARARTPPVQPQTPAFTPVAPQPAPIPVVPEPVQSPRAAGGIYSVPSPAEHLSANVVPTAAEQAVNEERLFVQRMTTWVEQVMQKYGSINAVRVFPSEVISRTVWNVRQAQEFLNSAQETLKKVTQEDSWLSLFQTKRIFFPTEMSQDLFRIPLDRLPQHERCAVLQGILEASGYSFINLVSTWYENPKLQGCLDAEILIELTLLRDYLSQEFLTWTAIRRNPHEGPQVTSSEVVLALRRPVATTISSIRGSNTQESQHVLSVDGAILDSPMSRLSRESAQAGAVVMTLQGDSSPDPGNNNELGGRPGPIPVSPVRQAQAGHALGGYPVQALPPSPVHQRQNSASGGRDPYAATTFAPASFGQYGPSYFAASTLPGASGNIPVSLGALHTQPNIQRVFIPQQAIPIFDGLGTAADRKRWLKQYLYIATYGGWTDAEKCSHFEIYFRGAAESWLLQLGRSTRRVWKDLERAFVQEFCTPWGTAFERYYAMRQSRSESPLNYLWRLNVTARSAKVPFHTYEGLKSHVTRFIRTLHDENTRRSLMGRAFSSVSELEETLKNFRDHSYLPRHESASQNKIREEVTTGRFKERRGLSSARVYLAAGENSEPDEEEGFTANYDDPPHVHFGATTEFSLEDAEEEWQQSGRSEEEYDSAEVYRASGSPQGRPEARARRDLPPRIPNTSRSNLRRIDDNPNPRKDSKCGTCGRSGHATDECWSQITCRDCGSLGHPAEVCWKKCDACKKVHDRGQCELRKVMEDLKRWSRVEGNSAELPSSVQKQLDALHLNF